MKRTLLTIIAAIGIAMGAHAQSDSTTFCGYLYNDDYEMFLQFDLYRGNITVPQHDIYGELPGYVGKKRNSFVWLITDAQITDEKSATLEMINDYGSEDLTATITQLTDSTYQLRQESGSTLKLPKKGKWQKIPKTITLKKKK